MDTRTPSISARGGASLRSVVGSPLRKALLASTALALAMMLPASGPARAQDATWQTNPGSGNFYDASNWSPSSVPTGTATFGASNTTTLTLGTAGSFGGWTLNAGASNYTFNVTAVQNFTGSGITINGGSATIANSSGLDFYNTSTAGNATIANNLQMNFYNASTAGGAIITNNGALYFYDTGTAGNAAITNNNNLYFNNTSTAGSATITNGSNLYFLGASTAGGANITNNGGLEFSNTSTAGNAALINSVGALVDFSPSTGPNGDGKLSAGSIAGAGRYILGSNELTVGSNNLSTEVSGEISGSGGSLVKTGSGTLTLSGTNTYTGGTTINGGTLQLGNAGGVGSILGTVTVGNGARFDVVNADTSGITTISNDWRTYFRNSTSAGSATIANNGDLEFFNTSTAGSATITNNSTLNFYDTSAAGSATITNNATLNFFDTGTADNASITNNNLVQFRETSTAGNATIINSGTLNFSDTSMAGSATITNNGLLQFLGTSAGSATITNNSFLEFFGISTAGSAAITNNSFLQFNGTSTAGSATFANTGALLFNDTSTAGSATFTNGGDLNFFASSTAGSANIVNIDNNSRLQFFDASTAGNATITNGGTLNFFNTSTAASATITNNSLLRFFNTSTAGDAALINNASGTVDFSNSTGPNGDGKLSAGSIAGAGSYVLGANELTVGSNNLSTEVSGAIFGSGSLVKTGTGTLTLTGANTYTGGTTINGGTVQLGNAGTVGSILGAVTVGNAATFDAATFDIVNADTSGITTISNNWRTYFRNSTSAGGATITNNNLLEFFDTSTAGSAAITNSGVLRFFNTSTADSATITNDGNLQFQNASTAGGATIANNNTLYFYATSTAGSATITNNGGLYFHHTSTAGSANITNNLGIGFYDSSTAGDAAITNNGTLSFNNASTAGSATITNSGSLGFAGTATADNANIINNNNLVFHGTSTAGSANITNNSTLNFYDTSTAGNATITNNGFLDFSGASTAGSATITNHGLLSFYNTSTAGSAALINNAGGTVDFSSSAGLSNGGRLSAGSIAGAGNYILGANELTVGSNNLSTEVSGVISGTGSLVKTGTGTLILSGANTYSGGTTISGGTLQFGNGTSGGSNNLGGSINVTGGTLAIQTPATLNVAQNVTFGDNTALSIAAGANGPALSADSVTIGNGVAFNINGITDASQLDMVLIDTASGISGDFAGISVGGFGGTVDYLTVSTRKSDDSLQYLANYGLTWNAGNNLADGTFTLTNATDSFTVGTVLADQAANLATGWNGTALTKAGDGTLTLTGTNTYTGGTTISGGTLQIGNGGTTGSITGNVVNDSVLAFNRSDTMTFAGVISGSGAVQQIGTGTLTLTGTNTYTGGTTVSGGTLQFGNGGATGSITGNVVNDGVLAFNRSDAMTFAGDISGSGAVQQIGTGTLTLTGANTYSGGTTISAGTLIGNTTGLQGDIVNNAALIFDQIATGTYAGVISGSGSLTKAGAGELILTGDSSAYSGTTDIVAGLLTINGSLGGVINFSGGTLGGSGSLGNVTIASGGSIAPGNSIGTLNVANITMAAGSTYIVELNNGGFVAGTNNDLINATGTATINGGTVHVTPVNGTDTGTPYTPGTYTILTAAGGVTGTFATLTDDYAFLNFALSYDANNVLLTSSLAATTFCLAGMSGNQCATGDASFSIGSGNLFTALLNLTAVGAPGALDQLSGEAHASFKTALIEDSRFIRNAVNDRIRAAFDAVGASGTVSTYDGGKPVTAKANTDRFAVWGQSFGSWGHTNGDGNAAHLDRNTGGFLFGADAPVFDTWRFGAVAGYSQTSFDVKDRQSSGSSDNYYVGLYGGTAWGDVAFRTGAAYTWHDVSSNRSVAFSGFGGNLKGDYNAATAQMFGELAYGFTAGSARFEPFANLAYVNLHTDGFAEQGGAAALTGASANTDATFATLGLRASTAFDIGGTTLTAKGMVGWRHAFGDMAPTSTMRFAGGGNAFNIGGVPIARDAAVIEAGLEYAITPNATLGVSYGGQLGSGISDQSARFNFNVKF